MPLRLFINKPIRLQRLLLLALLLVLLPVVLVQAGFSYQIAQQSSLKFQEQLASEISARIFYRVTNFFEIPRQVVRYNVEQFRSGILDTHNTPELQQNFLLQLDQQPLLTFVSMGNAQGDYYAAARPPQGEDRALRLAQANEQTGHLMSLYRVNAGNQRGELLISSQEPYDARQRPWFRAAVGYNSPRWYPAYRYKVPDPGQAFDALGIGMAAPLYDKDNNFAGVITADVALSQLSALLAEASKKLGSTAFLLDENGYLLAASTNEPLYQLKDHDVLRLKASNSINPMVRDASTVIALSNQAQGHTLSEQLAESYLLDWRQYPLPDGPTLTIASLLPQSRVAGPANDLLVNTLITSGLLLILCTLLSLWLSRAIAQPLVRLGRWATRLDLEQSSPIQAPPSPLAEIATLSQTLQSIAQRLQHHNAHLSDEVAARTAQLEQANRELAQLSNTDALTGIANRRRFDEVLHLELARAQRLGECLALIMLDVDHFKAYNDQYGHQAGDNCLLRVATVLANSARRPTDLIARYGGEEFVLIVSHSNLEDTLTLAEILRRKVEQLSIPHSHSPAGVVTISLGVAASCSTRELTAPELLSQADQALYRAKAAGRNRVSQ